jgi:PAS domain S-box-containing protein
MARPLVRVLATNRRFRGLRFCAYALATIGILLWSFHGATTAEEPRTKNVLFLFSTVEYSQSFLDVIEPLIRARVAEPINFYDAYLDDPQVEQKTYRESQAETFRQRYAGVKLDLVITNNPAAFHFAVQYRDKVFQGVPIVFNAVAERDLEGQALWPQGVTGVAPPLGFRETIDLALRLQPDTAAVAVISGVTSWDKRFLAIAHSELLRYQDKVKEIDLVASFNDHQILKKIHALPPHTVALFQVFPQYSSQPEFGIWDLLSEVALRLPTYSVFPRLCLNGCIGGAYEDTSQETLLVGEIAARVLAGERPEDIPIFHPAALQFRADWRALRRWHIPELALPSGALILNRQPTAWESYRTYIIAAVALMAVQSSLIGALLLQRARKRKAEAVLRESEKRFRVMADTTPSLIWMCDQDSKVIYENHRRLTFTGADPGSDHRDAWNAYVHSDDLGNVLDDISQALKRRKTFSMEYRLRRWDGAYRWMLDVAAPRVNGDESFAGFIGSAIDITDQKQAQEALEKIGGRLIEAQEKERKRIARELHDDICQKLALLSLELAGTNGKAHGLSEDTEDWLRGIRERCSEIGHDVHDLSHQLHSSQLEYLGLVPAIRTFCRELAEKHIVEIDCREETVPRDLPLDVSLCLFRVAQEALHNALKYSGVKHFDVEVSCTAKQVQLLVSDDGAGFDVKAAKRKSGLGFISMQERMNLVNGHFYVESRPGEGTKIVASAPLAEGDASLAEVKQIRPASGAVVVDES